MKNKKVLAYTMAALITANTFSGAPLCMNVYAEDTPEVEKHETVYVFTDASGKETGSEVSEWLKNSSGEEEIKDSTILKGIENLKGNETFSQNGGSLVWNAGGSDIFYRGTTDKEVPVSVKLTYFLDGKEMRPEDMAGADGEVTIRVRYENTEKDGDTYVPFMMVTGILLPSESVSGVKVDHGTVLSEGNNTAVVCYGFPGMQENLDEAGKGIDEKTLEGEVTEKLTDLTVPSEAEITMRAEHFSESMVMTFAMSDVLADKEDSLNLKGGEEKSDKAVGDLTDASGKLADGAKELADGLGRADEKIPEFTDGTKALSEGIGKYTDGVAKAADGASELKEGTSALRSTVDGFEGDRKTLEKIGDEAGNRAKKSAAASAEKEAPALAEKAGEAAKTAAEKEIGAKAASAAKQAADAAKAQAETGLDEAASGAGSMAADQAKTALEGQSGAISEAAAKTVASSGAYEAAKKQAAQAAAAQAKAADYSAYTGAIASGVNEAVKGVVSSTVSETMARAKTAASGIDVSSAASNIYAAVAAGTMSEEEAVAAITQLAQAAASGTVDQIAAGLASADIDITEEVQSGLNEQVGAIAAGVAENTAESVLDAVVPSVAGNAAAQAAVQAGEESARSAAESVYKQAVPAAAELAASGTADTVIRTAVPETAKQTAESVVKETAAETAGTVAERVGREVAEETASAVVGQFKDGAKKLDDGAGALSEGMEKLQGSSRALSDGASSLTEGADALADGVAQLLAGASDLRDGMAKFDQEGVRKISDLYNKDLKPLMSSFRKMKEAAGGYTSYAGAPEGMKSSVRFIIKSEEIGE